MLKRFALAAGSGVLLALAFPGPQWPVVAWVALTPLLAVSLEASPLAAFGWGMLQGVVFYAITLEWLYGFFRSYGRMSIGQSAGILGLMVGVLAAFTGGYGLGVRLVGRAGAGWALAASPFLWTACELGRARMPVLGFPWNLLGYAVSDHLGLVQLAALTGIYGLSWVVAGYNALALWAWRERRGLPVGIWISATAAVLLAVFAGGRLVPRPAGHYTAHLIQLNLRPEVSYGPDWERQHAGALDALGRLSVKAGRGAPGLVIWPEAPAPFSMQDPAFAARAAEIARESESDFLVGVDEWTFRAGRAPEVANSAVLLDRTGQAVFRYDKIHLVPFGEYVPWRKWLTFARNLIGGVGDFTPGATRGVGGIEGKPFAVFICYESIFPNEVRQFVDRGAGLLINISDDGWYGRSEALAQNLNMARVRAVENRRWLLRDTNTGITAAVDPYGRLRARLATDVRAELAVPYDFRSDRTLYTRWGDWWAKLAALVSLLAVAAGLAWRRTAGRL